MAAQRPQTIPVFLLMKTAYQILWQQRDDALRLGFIPTLILFVGILYGQDVMMVMGNHMRVSGPMAPPPPGVAGPLFVTLAIALLAMALVIANWLRFMLLGPMGAVGLGLAIGRPHLMFLISNAVLAFVGFIGLLVVSMPLLLLPGVLRVIAMVVAVILVLVAIVRFAPFVIGQAIDQPMSLQESWRASRGNGIPLTTALVLVQVPLWIAASLVSQILYAIGFGGVAPLAMVFIAAAVQVAMAILQASILAAAFRQIVGIQA